MPTPKHKALEYPKATHVICNGWAKTQLGLYGNLIEMIPIAWLDALNHPQPSSMTNLFNSERLVSLPELWKKSSVLAYKSLSFYMFANTRVLHVLKQETNA